MAFDYAAQILEGSPRAAARLISWLEDEDPRAYECMAKLYPHTGRAYVVGITGEQMEVGASLSESVREAIPFAVQQILARVVLHGSSYRRRAVPVDPQIWWEQKRMSAVV